MKLVMILSATLAGFAAKVPTPALCDMPLVHRSWQGAPVSWTEIVVGEYHHGYVLACEQGVGGIQIDWSDDTIGRGAFEEALRKQLLRDGLLRIKVEGRLGRTYGPDRFGLRQDPPILRIEAVRSVEFTSMSLSEFEAVRR